MWQYSDREFVAKQAAEVERARALFPKGDALVAALTEEVGELARAVLEQSWGAVMAEAVQVAAMAQRLATEGDPTLVEVRRERLKLAIEKGKQPPGSGFGPRCPFLGCPNPMSPTRPPCALCYE